MINYSIGKCYNPQTEAIFYRAYAQYTDIMDFDANPAPVSRERP